jgi:hypothetical protein
MIKIADYHIDKIRLHVITELTNGEYMDVTINSSDLSDETLAALFKDIDKRLEFKG